MELFLDCQRCTACCRWPGEVRMGNEEISAAAKLLGLPEPEFVEKHMRLRQDRRGLCLKEKPDGSCVFLENGNCAIQSAKPVQCREFPGRWVNSLWGKMPLDEMQRDYPMLFNCAAFKKFLKENRSNSVTE